MLARRQTIDRRRLLTVGDTAFFVCKSYYVFTGLKLRVRNENLIFLFLKQKICCGYSKEPSQ